VKAHFSANISAITTGQEQRDGHLKSDDFFNAEKYPTMTFESTGLQAKGGGEHTLTGNLTIRDVTQEVSFTVEGGGTQVDFYGNHKVGFEVSGKISRKAFGPSGNGITEAGSIVVSDDVRIWASVQFAKQA